jgi:nitric oxide reductase large subunit
MPERVRAALVRSYVRAIVTGWLMALGLIDAVRIFTTPLSIQLMRSQTRNWPYAPFQFGKHPWLAALPELVSSVLLLLIAYGLLRWLYFGPKESKPDSAEKTGDALAEGEQEARQHS